MTPEERAEVADQIAKFRYDPLGFVIWAFDWGTGDLADHTGPDNWQAQVLHDLGKELKRVDVEGGAVRIAIKSGHGVGKVLCGETIVPTPEGNRKWADIKVGDALFGADGRPTAVTARYDHTDWPFYRISFDDGSFAYAGPEHLWAVRGRQERRNGLDGWRTMSTEQIIRAGVKRPNGTALARQWEIPVQGEAEFEERYTELHPYLVGVWLGDGSKGNPVWTKPCPEIANRIASFGYQVVSDAERKTWRVMGHAKEFRREAFMMGSPDRYVPANYLFNSVEKRKEVLCGLLDTDGEVHHSGSIGFASTSRQLVDDVIWLVRSLGGKAMLQPAVKNGWYPDQDGNRIECHDCWRATINLPWNPFTVEHKKERYKPSERRYLVRWIDSIEFSHYGNGHCVTVDAPDHLYQANDFIVTHNSSLFAWLICFFMSTQPDAQIILTANTKIQLESKTWRELSIWRRRLINADWFSQTATKLYHVEAPDTWFCSAIPWSEENPEAFAGAGDAHSRTVFLFDEASAIANSIHETSEGALTRRGAVKIAAGNPTRNTGWFRECWRKFNDRWKGYTVDSRRSKIASKQKKVLDEWIADYGLDSDFVRVRILGEFPRAGSMQFISSEMVEQAQKRQAEGYEFSPRVLGVDVARFGDDRSVFARRQGARLFPLEKVRGWDVIQIGMRTAQIIREWEPHVVFVDGIGIGAGVVDYLRHTGFQVVDVVNSRVAMDTKTYVNLRAETWGLMRKWLETADIPEDVELFQDLIGPEYAFNSKLQIQLEKKEDMKRRGIDSPDSADAVAMTFANPADIGTAYNKWRVDDDYDDFEDGRSAVSGY